MSHEAILQAVTDFLETPQDAICACQAFRLALLAYLHNETQPEATVSAPRCACCDVLASSLARTIEQDPWGYALLAAAAIEGNNLALVLCQFIPSPPSRLTQ
jgi:hypothetical protein